MCFSGFVVAKAKVALSSKKNVMTLQELKEQLQEDLLCLTDAYLIDELGEEYEDFEDKMCQIVVDNFNTLKKQNQNGKEKV